MSEVNTHAQLFRALSHPARLTILRLTVSQALSGEHLARLLGLAPATVSQHLAQLSEVGLLRVQPDGHQKLFRAELSAHTMPLSDLICGQAPASIPIPDPYTERVLRSFIKGGKLVQIPAQRKKRDVILHHLGSLFEVGRQYKEVEVNALLSEYHPDFFTLRRELVGLGVLERADGIYSKPTPPTP